MAEVALPIRDRRLPPAIVVLLLLLVLTVGLGVWASTTATHQAPFSYRAIQRNAAFHFHVPRSAAQYEPVGGTLTPVGGSTSVWLEYSDPDGFVSLWEGNQQHPTLLRAMTGGTAKLGSLRIGGLIWDHYRHFDDILVHVFPDGVTVGVRTGSLAAERTLAAEIH